MNKMKEVMRYLDIFETKLSFYSEKKKTYYTTLGGIFSVISICLCIITFFFFTKDDLHRVFPDKIFISNLQEKEYGVTLIEEKLFIPWRIINKNTKLIDNNELINPVVKYYYSEKNYINETIKILKSKILDYKLCNETIMDNYYDMNPIGVKLNELYCINSTDIKLFTSSLTSFMNYINIDFYISNNNNISNYMEIEIYFPEVLFDPTNFKTPITINYKKYSFNINKYSKKFNKIFLQKNILSDDKGWFTKNITQYSYWTITKIIKDFYFSFEDDKIYSISINIEQNIKKYIRSYKKIYSIVSEGIPIVSLLFSILKRIALIVKTTEENQKLVELLFENIKVKKNKLKEVQIKKFKKTNTNTINNKKDKSKAFSEYGNHDINKFQILSRFKQNNNANNKENKNKINRLQIKFGTTPIYLKKRQENDDISFLRNDSSNLALSNRFPKKNFHINQIADQDNNKITPDHLEDDNARNDDVISKNKVKYVHGELFPYRYYLFLIFFKSIDISKNKFCFPKKFVKASLFVGQLLDISTYLLLQKEFHVLKNKCLTKEEVNELERNYKINIGGRKFLKMVNECITNQKFDILDSRKCI